MANFCRALFAILANSYFAVATNFMSYSNRTAVATPAPRFDREIRAPAGIRPLMLRCGFGRRRVS